jgi:hypothetical protein
VGQESELMRQFAPSTLARTQELPKSSRRFIRPLLIGVCLLGLGASLLWAMRDVRQFTSWKNSQLAAAQWTAAQLPPGATLLAFGLTLTLQHYSDVETIEIFELAQSDLIALVSGGRPLYLLLDVANVESQWPDLSPGAVYHWLGDEVGLVEIGRYPPFTLFEVTETSGFQSLDDNAYCLDYPWVQPGC